MKPQFSLIFFCCFILASLFFFFPHGVVSQTGLVPVPLPSYVPRTVSPKEVEIRDPRYIPRHDSPKGPVSHAIEKLESRSQARVPPSHSGPAPGTMRSPSSQP
ncbi:hypothetical protein V6N13_115728 [Hibiscus sabdariffa]